MASRIKLSYRLENTMVKYFQITTLVLVISFFSKAYAQENLPLRVFDAYRGGNSVWMKYQGLGQAWYDHLHQMADKALGQRAKDIQACTTIEAWEKRKKLIEKKLLKSIGGLPAKTPLNAKVLGKLERETFVVEKIIYESLPGFYVTACLFLPKEQEQPVPAVIYCSGHTQDGFRSPTYQRVIINLVQKGFAVLAFDPIGQGERRQYLDLKGEPLMGPTNDHSYAGIQAMSIGKSIASYMIHDGMRAVDYLLTRREVDPQRLGITGRSGGGTQSAYIAAFDERILAVAPENYITNFSRIWASIGPQDAEQNFLSAHKLGIDHGDLLAVRAPKPALILTTHRDFFSIQGARETYDEVKNIYDLYKHKDRLSFAEDDGGHGSTKANREKTYAFFQKYLNHPGNAIDIDVKSFSAEELQITQTGQVLTALNSKAIFDLVNEQPKSLNNYSKEEISSLIKANWFSDLPKPQAVFTGRVVRDDYVVEKFFLEFMQKKRYPIPYLSIKKAGSESKGVALYLNSEGKGIEIVKNGEIQHLLEAGYVVIAVDVLNIGELNATAFRGDSHIEGISYNLILGSSLVGTSLPELQAQDLMIVMDYLRQTFENQQVVGIADGNLCIPLLHIALADKKFNHLILKSPLISWADFLQTRDYQPLLAYTVIPGALSHYDIPDLMQFATTQNLTIVNPIHASGKSVSSNLWKKLYENVGKTYKSRGNRFSVKEKLDLIDELM